MSEVQLISGGLAVDDRGSLRFVNDFDPFEYGVRRFYQVENNEACTVRAWHGHKKEGKFVYVVKGSAIIAAAKIVTDKPEGPISEFQFNEQAKSLKTFTLSAAKPQILFIPPGFYNGFRTLEKGTILQFFSTSTLEESKGDDIRLPADYFGPVWDVVPR